MMQYVYTNIFYQNHRLTAVSKSKDDIQSILDTYLKNFTSIAVESEKAGDREVQRTMLELLNQLDGFSSNDDIKVIVLNGNGKHFSAGHDIGTPGRDIDKPFGRVAPNWYPHHDKPGAEAKFVREQEAYLGMCRRWRELPKPTKKQRTDYGALSISELKRRCQERDVDASGAVEKRDLARLLADERAEADEREERRV